MKFSINDFFSECDHICSFLRISSHLLKKSLMSDFIFCAVLALSYAEGEFLRPINRRATAKLHLLITVSAISQSHENHVLAKRETFLFFRISKFGRFKSPFEMIDSLSEFGYRQSISVLLVEQNVNSYFCPSLYSV